MSQVCTTLTVTAPKVPEFRLVEIRVEPDTVAPGETVSAIATVENVGSAGGTATVIFTRDGVTITSKSVYAPAGETREVEASFTAPEAEGTYSICAKLG